MVGVGGGFDTEVIMIAVEAMRCVDPGCPHVWVAMVDRGER